LLWRIHVISNTRQLDFSIQSIVKVNLSNELLASVCDRHCAAQNLFQRDAWLAVIGLLHAAQLPPQWDRRPLRAELNLISVIAGRNRSFLALDWEQVMARPVERLIWQEVSMKTTQLRPMPLMRRTWPRLLAVALVRTTMGIANVWLSNHRSIRSRRLVPLGLTGVGPHASMNRLGVRLSLSPFH
jgi:hypothetical protein